MSEIVRVGGWALRALGYPFGTAERGVRLLAWTEAVGGQAIRGLRSSETAIAQSRSASPAVHEGGSAAGWTVRANGQNLIELGGPAIDLVTHDARRETFGHVAVEGVNGTGFAASLANLLVHRNLAGLLIYRAAEADILPDRWSRAGWLVTDGAAGESIIAHGGLDGAAGDVLEYIAREGQTALSSNLAQCLAADIDAASTPGTHGYFGAMALSQQHSMTRLLHQARRSSVKDVSVVDYGQRLADALRHGVRMTTGDLKYLYDLEIRTWAPTSDRSRSQAGYGVF
jgi:hypothetical protein